jgi:hypothetical protein
MASVIGIHTVSAHSKPGFNGKNPGLFVQWANGVTLGAFYNSYNKTSAYAGWLWNIDTQARFGVLFALASGYGSTEERLPVAPVVAPTVRLGLGGQASARVSLFPDPRTGSAQVLHLSFEWRLD